MTPRKKITLSTALATALVAGLAAYLDFAPNPSDPNQPIVIWTCCSVLGCTEVDSPADCPATDDLVACCGPSTNDDGTTSCGCAATLIERKPVLVAE